MQLLVLPVQLHLGSLEDARDIPDQHCPLSPQLIPLQHMQLASGNVRMHSAWLCLILASTVLLHVQAMHFVG